MHQIQEAQPLLPQAAGTVGYNGRFAGCRGLITQRDWDPPKLDL